MAVKHTDVRKRSATRMIGRAVFAATDAVMEGVASLIRMVLKLCGSLLIVLLLSGMLFACIFAFLHLEKKPLIE